MYATLTLPAGLDLDTPRRSPTVRVRSADELRNALARRARKRSRWTARAWTGSCTWTPRAGCSKSRPRPPGRTGQATFARAASPWNPLPASRVCRPRSARRSRRRAPGPTALPVSAHVAGGHAGHARWRTAPRRPPSECANCSARPRRPGRDRRPLQRDAVDRIAAAQRRARGRAGRTPDAGRPRTRAPRLRHRMPAAASGAGRLPERHPLARSTDDGSRCSASRCAATCPTAAASLRWATREWAGVEIRFGTRRRSAQAWPPPKCAARCSPRPWRAAARSRSATCATPRASSWKPATRCSPRFLADKRRGDPAERLQNAWYRQVGATMRPESCEVRWARG